VEFERKVFSLPNCNIISIRRDIGKIFAIRTESEGKIVFIWKLIINALDWLVAFFNTENNYSASLIENSQELVIRRILKVHNWCFKNHSFCHKFT